MNPRRYVFRIRPGHHLLLCIALCLSWSCRSGSDAQDAVEGLTLAGFDACVAGFEQLAVEPPDRRSAIVAESCYSWVADEGCGAGLRTAELDAESCFERYCPDLADVVEGADLFCDPEERSSFPPTLRVQADAYIVAAAAISAAGGEAGDLRAVTQRLSALFEDLSLVAPETRLQVVARFVETSIESSRQIDVVAAILLISAVD